MISAEQVWLNDVIPTDDYKKIEETLRQYQSWSDQAEEHKTQAYMDLCYRLAEIEAHGTVPERGWEALGLSFSAKYQLREQIIWPRYRSYCLDIGRILRSVTSEQRAALQDRFDKTKLKLLADSEAEVKDKLLQLEFTAPASERPSDLTSRGLKRKRDEIRDELKIGKSKKKERDSYLDPGEPTTESPDVSALLEAVTTCFAQQENLIKTHYRTKGTPTEAQMYELWNYAMACYWHSEFAFNSQGLSDFGRKYNGGPIQNIQTRVRTTLPKVLYLPAFVSRDHILQLAYQHIIRDTENLLGGLYSFGNHEGHNISSWKMWGKTATMADCGAIQMDDKPKGMILNSFVERLIQFYIDNDFDFFIEPDSYHPDHETKLFHSILRIREFYRKLPEPYHNRAVRVIFGKDNDARLQCYKSLAASTGKQPDYVAIGGLVEDRKSIDKELRQLLPILNSEGVRKVHLLGLTSELSMRLAAEHKRDFDLISIDGSTWAQTAYSSKAAIVYNPAAGGSLERVYFKNAEVRGSSAAQKILKECPCPACEKVLLKEDEGQVSSVWATGELMTKVPSAATLFDLKAQLHNLWHQAQFLKDLLSEKPPSKSSKQHDTQQSPTEPALPQ